MVYIKFVFHGPGMSPAKTILKKKGEAYDER